MALKRREIDAGTLNGILVQHPWMTGKVAISIYWQALKLWFKRNPIYDHPELEPAAPEQATIITNRLDTKI